MSPPRAKFFIDGFNVFRALKGDPEGIQCFDGRPSPSYNSYYWLNYWKLAERLKYAHHELIDVYYFSAFYHWNPEQTKQHKTFVKALESAGVKIIMGKYKNTTQYCMKCEEYGPGRVEKQTDVNIAVTMFEEGLKDTFDSAYLMTADTDLVPAIKSIRRSFPEKQIGIVFPIGRYANELKQTCDFIRRIREEHLANSQFPNPIILPSGKTIEKPKEWPS